MSYYTRTFLVGTLIWGSISTSKLQTFSGIFWVLPIELYIIYQSIRKNDTRNFCLFVYFSKVIATKANICFYKQFSQSATRLICEEMLVLFFNSNIPLYIEKNTVEKSCKRTTQSVQYSFSRKSIIFNMILFACSKVLLLINYFDRTVWNTFKNTFWWLYKKRQIYLFYKRRQIFIFCKSRCGKFSLEIKLFIK